jgi:predicted nucleic acid-binding protein
VRIASNPIITGGAASLADSIAILAHNLEDSYHRFWPDSLGLTDALKTLGAPLLGHRQVTDAYLLALAIQHGGRLATRDRALLSLLPPKHPHRRAIELVEA